MSILSVSTFDLDALRGSFALQFAEWDRCVAMGSTQVAKEVRREIKAIASASLKGDPATHPGFYLFVDPREDGISGLRYIGIAKTQRRPIAGRIVDRLRDDSGLDSNLDHLPDDDFRRIVLRRLLIVLPTSGQNYVEKHLRVARLFRASRTALLISCDDDAQTIAAVEKALIGSAAAVGASLFNAQHVGYRGPVERRIVEFASTVISACTFEGLSLTASEQWDASLRRLTQMVEI
jgi:hypothetical protein